MDLWIVAALLFGCSVILLAYSFFKEEPEDDSNSELEDATIELYDNIHYLKNRVETLEKKLDVVPPETPHNDRVTKLTENNVLTLFTTRGMSAEEIADRLRISEVSVQHIIDEYVSEGIK